MRGTRRVWLLVPFVLGALLVAAPMAAQADSAWTGSGPGTISVSGMQMSYSLNGPAVWSTQTWTFDTTASTTGTRTLNYDYSGFHAFFEVRAFLNAFVTHNSVTTYTSLVNAGPANCCSTPSNGFHYTGSVTLNVQGGDTYGFTMGGSNYDSTSVLSGTLTLSVPKNPTATAVACSPGSIVAGSGSSTCTATVADTGSSGQSAPTGTVAFATDGSGTLSGGAQCTLAPVDGSSSSCSVTYTPDATPATPVRTDTISASYGGDDGHLASAGSAQESVISLPTGKDQCKNGGWKAYTVFKNQGDCVSYVATGGRNQPAG